ncbi:hypothetical protein ACIOGW_28310 [Streptomyces anulatus]
MSGKRWCPFVPSDGSVLKRRTGWWWAGSVVERRTGWWWAGSVVERRTGW